MMNDALPADYRAVLDKLKDDVRTSRNKAALAVNRELIGLYWRLGQTIVEQQDNAGWGKRIVKRLAADLQDEFPDIKGFSPSNLWRMRSFYLAWTLPAEKLAQAVRVLEELPQHIENNSIAQKIQQKEFDSAILAQLVRELPWGHNVALMEKVKDPTLRLWYLQKALIHGWSRNILTMQIETCLHERQGKAITNFPTTLPSPNSELAVQTLKDPYNFDFLGLGKEAQERDLEKAMLTHLKRFLLELGDGFAFVGQQYRITVGSKDYHVDLLFYHIRLRAYIAVELKAGAFSPADVGQLNHYLSALDDKLRQEGDNPAIGLLLCRGKDKLDVEYALRGMQQPLAVADYRLTKAIPNDLKGALPSIEEIESEFEEFDV